MIGKSLPSLLNAEYFRLTLKYIQIIADNYLEKQYEDYQARKAAWEWERKHGKKMKKTATQQPEPVLPPHPDDADFIEEEEEEENR